MAYEIVFADAAAEDMASLDARRQSVAFSAIETHLRHEPTKTSRSRIKRLQGVKRPQYRLRVEDLRILYDVEGETVEILAVVAKSKLATWLKANAEDDDDSGTA
jgi:mRNA interferase RelE/StbE